MLVQEIMSGPPYAVQEQDAVQRAAQEMRLHNVGALPVRRGDELVGIITDRDIAVGCVAAGHRPEDCRVIEHMTAKPISISPQTTAEEAMQRMAQEQVRRLCVVDQGQLVGMISLGDLALRIADQAMLARTLAQISQGVRTPQIAAA